MINLGRNTDYDEIKNDSTDIEKINIAINIIRKSGGPEILDYRKLNIPVSDEKLFDVKLKKTDFVTFNQNETAYHPTYFISDNGYLKLEEYGNYLSYINSKKEMESDSFPNKTTITDFLSNNLMSLTSNYEFIDRERIESLENIENKEFDLTKLTILCKEINDAYQFKNYFSVGVLIRIILDHIPPIFEKKSFKEVANNYGEKSFRDLMLHLENSSRKIADGMLHSAIKSKEILPNASTIEYRSSLDRLLGEIILKLSTLG